MKATVRRIINLEYMLLLGVSFFVTGLFFSIISPRNGAGNCRLDERSYDIPLYVFQVAEQCLTLSHYITNLFFGGVYLSLIIVLPFVLIHTLWRMLFSRFYVCHRAARFFSNVYVIILTIWFSYGYSSGLWLNSGGEYCGSVNDFWGRYMFALEGVKCNVTLQLVYEVFFFWTTALIPLLLLLLIFMGRSYLNRKRRKTI